jgi:hypothetical protein
MSARRALWKVELMLGLHPGKLGSVGEGSAVAVGGAAPDGVADGVRVGVRVEVREGVVVTVGVDEGVAVRVGV